MIPAANPITVKTMAALAGNRPAAHGLLLAKSGVPHDFPLHSHDYYELELILEGRGTQWINGRSSPLLPGCIYFLRPSDLHRLQVELPLRLYNLKIAVTRLPRELRILLESQSGPAAAFLEPEALRQTLQDLERLRIELYETDLCQDNRLHALLLLLLTDLFRVASVSTPDAYAKPSFKRFQICLQYIRLHYQTQISLKDAAAAAGITPNYLSHQFPVMAGCSFVEYVNRQRLQLALCLLSAGGDTVTGIAFTCGFGSLANFLRTFRRIYGMTPGQYSARQTNRAGSQNGAMQ
ncbi:MAG: AraC family transcriptional regulator [Clostridiaceae bacterium]|nr:AraC family transcriptional regulator [Clostridiaceae bacterium]